MCPHRATCKGEFKFRATRVYENDMSRWGGPFCICRANPCLPGHNSTGSGLAMNKQVLPVSYPRRDLKPMMIDTHRDVARQHIELDLHGYVLMLIKKRGIPIPGPTGETKGVDLTEEYLFTGGIGSQPRSTIGKRKMGRDGKQTGVWAGSYTHLTEATKKKV